MMAHSVISADETDRRLAALTMLTTLVEAAGHDLVVGVRPSATLGGGFPTRRSGDACVARLIGH